MTAEVLTAVAAYALGVAGILRWRRPDSHKPIVILLATAALTLGAAGAMMLPESVCQALRKADAAQLANLAASALVWLTATAAATVYHLKAPWRRSRIGRHIMGVTISIGLLGLYTILAGLIWPTGPVIAVLRVLRTILLVALAGMMVQRVRLVIDAQREPVQPPGPPPQ
jgi:hypothetical protein